MHAAPGPSVVRTGKLCAWGVVLVGILALAGWLFSYPPLYGSIFHGSISTKPVTILALLLAAASLALQLQESARQAGVQPWRRLCSDACGLGSLILAADAVLFHFVDLNSGLAERIARVFSIAPMHGILSQISPLASVCLVLLGLGLLFARQPRFPALAVQLLCIPVLLAGTWAVIEFIIRLGAFSGISVNAAIGCLLLGFGTLLLRPPQWLTDTVFRRGPAARFFLWLPGVMLAPIVLAAFLEQLARTYPGFRGRKDELLVLLFTLAILLAFVVALRVIHTTELRRAAELRLRRQQQRYRRIVEGAHDGILLTDAAGNIDYANPSLERMLGYAPGELRGKPGTSLLPADQADLTAASPLPESERRLLHRDGSELWVLQTVTDLPGEKGRPGGRLAMVTDITARKTADAERQRLEGEVHRAQLEGVRKAVATYMHELNSPLAGLLASVDMLLDDSPTEEHRLWLLDMQDACRRMAQVLRSMEDIQALRAGQAGGHRGPLDLRGTAVSKTSTD